MSCPPNIVIRSGSDPAPNPGGGGTGSRRRGRTRTCRLRRWKRLPTRAPSAAHSRSGTGVTPSPARSFAAGSFARRPSWPGTTCGRSSRTSFAVWRTSNEDCNIPWFLRDPDCGATFHQGELSVDLREVRDSRRLNQSFPLKRPKKHHTSRKRTHFPGHLELEIKWMDFLEGG